MFRKNSPKSSFQINICFSICILKNYIRTLTINLKNVGPLLKKLPIYENERRVQI